MTDIGIYRDSRNAGVCRSCGARIEWAELTTGKRMPFDADIIVRSVHESPTGRIIELVDMTRSKSHFATCPQANEWRRNHK